MTATPTAHGPPIGAGARDRSPSPVKAPQHLSYLDGLRGLAALYVVMHHSVLNVTDDIWKNSSAARLLGELLGYGHYAVDLFIVLSGYCLVLPLLRRPQRLVGSTFLVRRAARILPPYYAAVLLSLLLIWTVLGQKTGTHWDVCIPVGAGDIAAHLALIQEWLPWTTSRINHTHWSVAVEWKIYFLFPLLLAAWARIGPALTLAVTVVVSYLAWLTLQHFDWLNPGPWGSSVYYLGLFNLGMFAAQFAEAEHARAGGPRRAVKRAVSLGLLTFGAAALILPRGAVLALPLQVASLLVGAWSSVLLVALRLQLLPAVLVSPLKFPITVWLGRQGFSLYLIHAPIIQLAYLYVVRPSKTAGLAHSLLMVFAGTAASIAVSACFYRFIERPCHQWSRRLRDVRR